ncbi:MAG: fibrillarin-like rRNA/tRNA 2'-O-methyltransferase [Candidatus Thermoplasmatota archaeon]|jgi:fibrillarin-like pre-rRNA processing protein|nr:fibrillarin-like rRNA/tRNA 2'-O-methyltransferase [Candidatus Sysuiplasma jiujiangense]MBX8639633.1 fibrillarin-like rRNA/tRNA 2'-O-methyltransferase [Candidatus Sysuiplasma jiujiangense]MCL5253691.1 fibrillarin-like rRNA/tRNA 2'-O-methyltransferase [Candidatus Thermoplasmatota archaeon]
MQANGSIARIGGRLYTKNSRPGWSLGRERLEMLGGNEYREWDPYRSKLSAYLECGGKHFPFDEFSRTLYLGAAAGTTASHVADISPSGKVYCIEKAFGPYSKLAGVCSLHDNMVPVMCDANRPESYEMLVENPQILYQDIAQKNLIEIFIRNARHFPSLRHFFVVVKSRSVDSSADPVLIFKSSAERLTAEFGCRPEIVDISAFEKDHAVIAFGR